MSLFVNGLSLVLPHSKGGRRGRCGDHLTGRGWIARNCDKCGALAHRPERIRSVDDRESAACEISSASLLKAKEARKIPPAFCIRHVGDRLSHGQ
jgi:hypothetical protein